MTNTTNANSAPATASEVRTCPRCGLTETMLRTVGLLGCASCYETFEDLVIQAAEALHGVVVTPPALPEADILPETALQTAVELRRRKSLTWLPRRMQAHLPFPPESPPLPPTAKKKRLPK